MRRSLFALVLLVTAALPATAQVALNGIFADRMVLQSGMPLPIWGTADAGETVTVTFADQTGTATAGPDGRWKVMLTPLAISRDNRTLTVRGSASATPVTINQVLVGEVWLCGGQSNMEWALARSTGGEEAIAGAANPLLRMGRVPHNSQMSPANSVAVAWTEATPATAKFYSAVPFWFGAKLQAELGVPVGIINNSYGGTRIEAWLSAEVLAAGPWPQDAQTVTALAKTAYDQAVAAKQPEMDRYLAEKAKARAEKRPEPPMIEGWPGDFRGPSVLWNGEVAPIVGFPMRGMVWYQGESNSGAKTPYGALLKELARSYRAAWGIGDFPLIMVQLSTYKKPGMYAEIRETQARFVAQDPKAALVVTLDLGDADADVHYRRKEPVGERVTKAALATAYGKEIEASGPVPSQITFADGAARVTFAHLGGGLVAKDGPLLHFTLAGADKVFVEATAEISGDTVVVRSPQVPTPVAVRYAFSQWPVPDLNFVNQAGLPAAPFRSDDWPVRPTGRTGPATP